MNTRPKRLPPFQSGWHSGLTLIEVVAGIALAGALLVGILLSMSSQTRGLRQLQLGEAGLEQLDKLLSYWAQSDFKNEKLEQAAKDSQTQLEPAAKNKLASVEPELWVRITNRPIIEHATWNLEKVRLEAISINSGSVVAAIEIVRHAQ